MYTEKLENLINAALAKGVLLDSDKELIIKTAESEGIDQDEIELVLEERFDDLEFMRDEISLCKADDGNTSVQEESYDNLSSIISRLRANYDAIYITKVDRVFRPYTKTGKRGEYHDVTGFDERATKEAKKNYLLSLYPKNKVETLATLIFLSSFLPSCDEVVKGVSTIEEVANKRFRSVYNEAKTKYNSDTFFSQKLEDIRNDYNEIYDRITREQDDLSKKTVVAEKKIKMRKIRNWIFLALIPVEWIWLNVFEEWDWWWCLALSIPILGVIGLWILFVQVESIGELKDDLDRIKLRKSELKTTSEIFNRIEE